MKTQILGISGSIRSNYKKIELLQNLVNESESQDELNDKIKIQGITFSNTDIALAHALLGAKKNGSDIRLISLTKIFEHKNLSLYENLISYETVDDIENIDTLDINEKKLLELLAEVESSEGVILGTPVYFGDRSSVANKLLQLTNKNKLLKNKAFGVLSVGAKRNGGQETTNIYTLYEALMQEAVVVGNGPKTAQYGGTVYAGDLNKAVDDSFGLETSYGVGRQVSQLAKILKASEAPEKVEKLNITILLTMDSKDKKYEKLVSDVYSGIDGCNIVVYNLTESNIYRCVACGVCPSPNLTEKLAEEALPYNCIVQSPKDSMRTIQEVMSGSDCIIIAGVNSQEDLIYRYQAFLERTRFIRRNDFELTNIPIIGLLINELGAINNPLHNVKVLTSFIRHNSFILKPMQIIFNQEEKVFEDDFESYLTLLQRIKVGRDRVNPLEVSYKATGYADKRLDSTVKIRK